MNNKSNHRLEYLDALRGLAALYVIIFHIHLIPKVPLALPSYLIDIVGYGGSGVTLFFVISGFSMALTWHRYQESCSPLLTFYVSRFARVAPLLYFWLFLMLIAQYYLNGGDHIFNIKEIILNILLIFNFDPSYQKGIVWASWTIGVEIIFYAIFPILAYLKIINIKNNLIIVFLFILLNLVLIDLNNEIINPLLSSMGILHHLPVFCIGILIYGISEILKGKDLLLNIFISRAILLIGISVIFYSILNYSNNIFYYYISALAYGLILLSFCLGNFKNWAIRKLSFLGKISYSLYLNHPILIFLLSPLYAFLYTNINSVTISFILSIVVSLSLLIGISIITYYSIERPGMNFAKKIYKVKRQY